MVKLYKIQVVDHFLSEVSIFKTTVHPGIPTNAIPIDAELAILANFKIYDNFEPSSNFYYEVSSTVQLNKYKFNTLYIINSVLDFFDFPVIVEHKYNIDEDIFLATVNAYRKALDFILYAPVFIEGFKIYKV